MPIVADPVVITAKILDKYWVHSFSVGTTGVGGAAILRSSLIPYNAAGDVGSEIALDPISVFDEVQVDQDAAVIFSLFMAYVEKKAKQQGKISAVAEQDNAQE